MSSEDITFCGYEYCPNKKCERHQSNIKNFNIPHSFAYFHDCNKYPPMEFSKEEQKDLKMKILGSNAHDNEWSKE